MSTCRCISYRHPSHAGRVCNGLATEADGYCLACHAYIERRQWAQAGPRPAPIADAFSQKLYDEEYALRAQLRTKTLLGEVHFDEDHCAVAAAQFQTVIKQLGVGRAIDVIRERWPIMFAIWLTNEAFFRFEASAYWPKVLPQVGLQNANQYSALFGRTFIDVVEQWP